MAEYTAAQREALILLMEECAEVIQAVTKCLRRGEAAYNPFDDSQVSNREALNKELGHVSLVTQLAVEQGVVDADMIVLNSDRKRSSISRWLHHLSRTCRLRNTGTE